ncbi:MAG: peptidylprolyl isomerase [Bacilli bacterium]
MKKKLVVLALCLLVISGCGKKIPKLSNGDEVVVSFKNGNISTNSLYEQIKSDYALQSMLYLVDVQILEEKYNDKVEEAKDYTDANIEQLKTYYGEDNLLQVIQQYTGYQTIEAYNQSVYVNYLRNLAVEDYAKDKIEDKEVEKYYKNNIVGDIKVAHILITPETTDEMTQDEKTKAESAAKEKAEEVIKKLNEAKDKEKAFTDLAKEYSSDATTKETGGSLGYINKGTLGTSYAELEDAAYKLKDGEYSKKVVTTELGYEVIIRLDSKDKAPLEDVKDSILETLSADYLTDNPDAQIRALQDLRKDYDIDIIDSELKEQYANYIQNALRQAEEQKKQQEQQNSN